MHGGVARDHEEIPGEGRRQVIAPAWPPPDDLTVEVALARVRPAHGRRVAALVRLPAPVLVVGEAAIDFGLLRVRRHPLRAVHGGRSHRRGRHAGMNTDFRHRGHAGGRGRQRNPLPPAAVGELRREQRSRLQEIGVVATLDVASLAHELVDELAALVVPHIDDHPPAGGEDDLRVLVLEAAEGGALSGRRDRVERVDLDDVAGAVRLIGMPGDIEALVRRRPGVAPVLAADAVSLELGSDFDPGVARGEVAVKILLAREIGAPGGAAAAAVVPGTEAPDADGVGGRPEQVVPARGACNLHGSVGGDSPVVGRILDDAPRAVLLRDLHDRHPVSGLALAHVVGRPGTARALPAVEGAEIHVFVVDREDAAPPGGEQFHAVVVVAEGESLARRVAARRRVEFGRARPHRVSPAGDDAPAVSLGNGDRVEGVGGNGVEPEPVRGGERGKAPAPPDAQDESARGERGAPA